MNALLGRRLSVTLLCAAILGSGLLSAGPTPSVTSARFEHDYGRVPLAFEANEGQFDPRIRFVSRSAAYTLFLTEEESVIALPCHAIVHLKLAGSRRSIDPVPEHPQPGISNYFVGPDPSGWRTNIAHYGQVRYPEVYPGIDLIYHGNQRRLEYDFDVAPDADPDNIRLVFRGANSIEIDADGDLLLSTPHGTLRQHRPVAYQEIDGRRVPVTARYLLRRKGEVRFALGPYDHSRPLVIDPTLSYSTYLGGTGYDSAQAIAVDNNGNAYITGQTTSTNFPLTGGAYLSSFQGSGMAFVSKINASGTALLYSTYLGGNGQGDAGLGIAVDAYGDAYVTGYAGGGFPATVGAFSNSGYGAFVTELNPSGTALLYSTTLGGSGYLQANAIAIDSNGSAYIAGHADASLPATPGSYQTTFGGGYSDAFVAALNSTGSALLYATYLGGQDSDSAAAIAVDSSGQVTVAGYTYSTNFPTSAGAFQRTAQGSQDAFVARLNASGTALVYSTYLGGAGSDLANAVALDSQGNAVVVGIAGSPSFPTTLGAFQTSPAAPGFIAKVNPTGSSLLYSTYLNATPNAVKVSTDGTAHVTGRASCCVTLTPTAGAIQSTLASAHDAFYLQLNSAGSATPYVTFLGGSSDDAGNAIALDFGGNVYIAGQTASTDFLRRTGSLQSANRGGTDAFLVKLTTSSVSCSYSLSATTASMNAAGGTASVSVTAPAGCAWVASAGGLGWVTITSGGSGTGNGTVSYSVAANSSTSTRSGTLAIAGQSYTVNQTGIACAYSISPTTASVAAGGGSGSVSVTATSSCSWTAASNAPWITVTSGNGSVSYSVAANTGTQRTGTVTIAGQTLTVTQAAGTPPPAFVSLTPSAASGSQRTLTVVGSSSSGYQALSIINLLVNSSLDSRQSCYLAYARSINVLYLVADSGDPTQITGQLLGSWGTLANSQCSIDISSSSASGSGNNLTLTLNVSFSAAFAGNKVIYAAVRDSAGGNSGWQTAGVHQAPGFTVTYPYSGSISPAGSAGLTQTLTFTFQDSFSALNLQTAWMLINSSIDSKAACFVAYYRPGNMLYLYPDNGDGTQATAIPLTGANTISNSQCAIAAQGSSVLVNGNTMTVILPISFKQAFAGNRAIWMAVQTMGGAQTSTWQALGAWQAPAQ